MSSEQSPVPDGAAPDESDAPASSGAGAATAAETRTAQNRAGETSADRPRADEVEIEDVVDPTTVRRAPRYGAFLTVGVLLGTVLGLGLGGAWLQSPAADPVFKPGVYFSVIVLSSAALGAAVAGLWAVIADRRSLRRR